MPDVLLLLLLLLCCVCCLPQQGYLPRDLYQLDSCYGSEADLRELINKCHEHNIKVIADIVVNHRWVLSPCPVLFACCGQARRAAAQHLAGCAGRSMVGCAGP